MNKKMFYDLLIQEGILEKKSVTLKSGETSDFYYDFGKLSSAKLLKISASNLFNIIICTDLHKEMSCLFTSAYKGINLTTALLIECSNFIYRPIRMGYLRKEKKDHGDQQEIVGYTPSEKDSVILIDDVFTTGSSVLEMYNYLKDKGCKIIGVIVLINRSTGDIIDEISQEIDAPIFSVLTHDDVINSETVDFQSIPSLKKVENFA